MLFGLLLSVHFALATQSPSRPKAVTASELEKLAQESAAEKDWESAADEYRRAVELDPHSVRLHIELGEALAAAGDYPRAISAFTEALHLDPRLESAQLKLAEAYRRIFNYDQARQLLERAQRDHPTSADVRQALDRLEAEMQHYQQAANQIPAQTAHLLQQAEDFAKRSQFTEAVDLVTQAVEKDPANAELQAQLAKFLSAAGEQSKAEAAIQKSLAIRPNDTDYLYIRGKIFEKENRPEEALQVFDEIILINSKRADAYFEIGSIRQQQGKLKQAREAYKKAIDLDPTNADYRKALDSTTN